MYLFLGCAIFDGMQLSVSTHIWILVDAIEGIALDSLSRCGASEVCCQ